MSNRRYTEFSERKLKSEGGQPDPGFHGPNVAKEMPKESTGPFKPLGKDGSNSGFNKTAKYPELKAYVKKSGI